MDYIRIYDVAKQLNVSHTTIYNKLKNKEIYKDLKPFIKKSGKSQYISIDGINILKNFITSKGFDFKENISDFSQSCGNEDTPNFINLQETLLLSLQDRIKELEKDKEYLIAELESRNKHIETQSRLLENSQVLLRESSQQKLLLLESKPIGFFKRLFKKTSN